MKRIIDRSTFRQEYCNEAVEQIYRDVRGDRLNVGDTVLVVRRIRFVETGALAIVSGLHCKYINIKLVNGEIINVDKWDINSCLIKADGKNEAIG